MSSPILAGHRQSRPSSRPRQSPPSSFCEWQSRAESPTRVLRQVPSPSPPGSSRPPRQSRPKLFWSPSRFVPRQSLCMESPLESSNKPRQARPVSVRVTRQALQGRPPAVIRRPCQSRPLSVPESGQECRSSSRPPRSFRPPVVHRCCQTRPPSSWMSRPRQTTVVRRARPCRPPSPPESPAKFLLKVCQSSPVTARVAQIRASSPQESRQAVFASAVPLEFRESADARRPSASHTTPKTNLVVHRKFPPGHGTVTHPVINCEQARYRSFIKPLPQSLEESLCA